jgi:hypothetical protein
MDEQEEVKPVKEIDFEKDVQPCIDSLFTGKYDIIVKPKEEIDAPCNVSLILRVLLVEFSKLAKTVQQMEKCVCKT